MRIVIQALLHNLHNPHFTNEESAAQGSEVNCLSNPAKSGRTQIETQLTSMCALDCYAIPPLRKTVKSGRSEAPGQSLAFTEKEWISLRFTPLPSDLCSNITFQRTYSWAPLSKIVFPLLAHLPVTLLYSPLSAALTITRCVCLSPFPRI